MKADLQELCDSWRATFLGERLYLLSFYYFSLYFSLFVRSRNCELLP